MTECMCTLQCIAACLQRVYINYVFRSQKTLEEDINFRHNTYPSLGSASKNTHHFVLSSACLKLKGSEGSKSHSTEVELRSYIRNNYVWLKLFEPQSGTEMNSGY